MSERVQFAVAATGAANLASVLAMCARAKVEASITTDPDLFFSAERALLPGVGAFGAAMEALRRTGLAEAVVARAKEGRPLMGICLGMQLFCSWSEESPGVPGLGVVEAEVKRFRTELPLPQLGWNRVSPSSGRSIVEPGWAYFANSYRLEACPSGFSASECVYGEAFPATLEAFEEGEKLPRLLLCQFHPELSGPWGLRLFRRWMGIDVEEANRGR